MDCRNRCRYLITQSCANLYAWYEFRTAPLWGVGQRVFLLHDGRTTNLVEAIQAHRSQGSEANRVIEQFNRLKAQERQDIIDFLRSL